MCNKTVTYFRDKSESIGYYADRFNFNYDINIAES